MSGPGKGYRNGITLAQLFKKFPDDAAAETYFIETRWPKGPHCPYCGSANVLSGAKHKTMPYRCREKHCRKRFSVKTGTAMEASNIGYRNWAIATYLMLTSLKSVSAMTLHRDLGITHKSAWFMMHLLREAMKEVHQPFLGPVEGDESYFGGSKKNMHRDKAKAIKGRGTVGKTIVVGVKDRRTNQISVATVEAADAYTLQTFIEERVSPDATVFTDDARLLRMPRRGPGCLRHG